MRLLKCVTAIACILFASNSFGQWTYKDFRKIKNMDGNWEAVIENGYIQEKWSLVNDSTLVGEVYKIVRGVSILDEKTKITYTSNGDIIFSSEIHYLNKGVPMLFKLVKTEGGKFIFENKDKAFAQQISYQMNSSDKMKRTVNRTINGKEELGPKAIDYAYHRIEK